MMSVSAIDELSAWKAAVVAKGYSYQSHIRSPLLRGLLFRTGDSVVATSLVSALQAPTPFFAGSVNGRYTTAEQDSRSVSSSFVAIPLARKVPNAVLLFEGVDVLRSAGVVLQSRQRLSSNDYFDGPFTLYSHGGSEREAVEIFTPAFLTLLAETTDGADVELIDTWMFIYARPGRFGSEKALEDIERITKHVKANVLPNIEPNAPVATVAAEPVELTAQNLDATARLSAREDREARTGAIAVGRDVLDARHRELGRLVGVGIGAFAVGAAAWWFISDVLLLL
jgi:hypothetical protein